MPVKAGTVQRLPGPDKGQLCAWFLRRTLAPHLLVPLDSLVPPPLAHAGLKVRCHLRDVLTLAHHTAAHLVAVSIDC